MFRSLEQQAEERRRRVLEAQMVVAAAAADDHQVRSKPKHRSNDEDFEPDSEHEATESDDEIQICEICDTE